MTFARMHGFRVGLLLAMAWGTAAAEVNIAPVSRVVSRPYIGATLAYLTDGKIATAEDHTAMLAAPLTIRTAQPMPLHVEFTFPGPVRVSGVRLFQRETQGRRPATGYVIELDTDGSRRYGFTIVEESEGRGGAWKAYRLSAPVVARGLRFRSTRFAPGPGPNYGGPTVEEFEIFAEADVPSAPARVLPDAPPVGADSSQAKSLEQAVAERPPATPGTAFRRALFGAMWLFWEARGRYSEAGNAEKVALLRKLNVNRYWLYPGVYAALRPGDALLTLPANPDYLHFIERQWSASNARQVKVAPFRSEVVPGVRDNALVDFVAQMHRAGVRVVVNESLLPFGVTPWDFPRVADTSVYPSVLSSSFVREASTRLYREFMESGVDGLVLGGDEFFLYGDPGDDETGSPVCRDGQGGTKEICRPTSRELFERRFGTSPRRGKQPFSPAAAKWTLFKYEQLASLFSAHRAMMKATDPEAIVTSLFRPGEENRPAYGVAYDVMGALGGVDEMGSNPYWSHDSHLGHYYFANETKRLAGASPLRLASVTLQATPAFDRHGYRDPRMVYGPAFSALMHGAIGVGFYKHDYLFAGGRHDAGPWVKKFFDLTTYLERRDLLSFTTPPAVALVYSRASEDWWELAHRSDPVKAVESRLAHSAVMEVLFRQAIPFEVFYLDQPASLAALADYTVAILAHPHSVSAAALDKLREAANRGTAIVAVNRRGEVDEFGHPHPRPVLGSIASIRHLDVDFDRADYPAVAAAVVPAVMEALRGVAPLAFDAAGRDVECTVRERDASRLVYCLNWEAAPVDVNLGLALPAGRYAGETITLTDVAPLCGPAGPVFTEGDLRHFRLRLEAGEAKVLAIQPLAGAAPAWGCTARVAGRTHRVTP